MPKPILLAIDDDISVLEAVVQDLRRNYGQDYRIVRAASGAAALDICHQLKERNDIVALFLSDQRMPGMTGVDFLQQALTSILMPNESCSRHTPTLRRRSVPLIPQKFTITSTNRGIRQRKSSTPYWTICSRPGSRATSLPLKELGS